MGCELLNAVILSEVRRQPNGVEGPLTGGEKITLDRFSTTANVLAAQWIQRRACTSPRTLESYRHSYRRLIREATYPAPNPLSMFTTLTFDAQEFSIPSSAAKPWKLAP